MSSFSSLLLQSKEYKTIEYNLKKKLLPMGVLGLPITPKAHLVHTLCTENNKKALIITNDEASATKLCSDLNAMGTKTVLFPAADKNFRVTESRSREYERKRLGVLGIITEDKTDAVVCSIEAAMQLTIPEKVLIDKSVTLKNGYDTELDKVVKALIAAGYVRTDMVEGEGHFALRGSILDFFPPDCELPIRVEFWGDTIDSMAYFDILTQRRGDNVDEIRITPATEIVFDDELIFAEKI